MPHVDDFDPSHLAALAQNACICIDCALRWAIKNESHKTDWVEYAFEPLRIAISLEMTGQLDMGAGKTEDRLRERIAADPRFRKELALQREDIEELRLAARDESHVEAVKRVGVWRGRDCV
jgi:hypothetical protein